MKTKNGRQLLSLVIGMVSAGAFIAGCGNFSQDPLEGKLKPGDELREPGNDTQKPRERVPSDALVIDAPDYINYKEEVDGGPKSITGRVLIPVGRNKNPKVGRDFDIEILNLKDFVGAKYDSVKGQFLWTPPKSTVNDLSREMDLNVSLTTRSRPVLQRQKTIKVYITRGESIPEVISIDGLSRQTIKEGDQKLFSITVKDVDASDTEPPKLLITSPSSTTGPQGKIAQFISVQDASRWDPNPTRDPSVKGQWRFKMMLNLYGQELTARSSYFNFDAIAVSRFGKLSAPKTEEVEIRTSVGQPTCSLGGIFEIPGGVQSVVNFTIQDPKGEGRVTANFSQCATVGAQCKCVQNGWSGSMLNCTMTWTPPQPTYPTDYWIHANMVNSNPMDSTTMTAACSGKVRVVRGPTPVPTVAPTAVPTESEDRDLPRKRRRSRQ